MKSAAIRVSGLSKAYKLYGKPIDRLKEALNPFGKSYHSTIHALRNVSLEVAVGETIAVIGKNGSGKSTLLKIIAGVLTPSGGSVEVNGKVAALLELGAGFNPEFTGLENIYFTSTITGHSKAQIDAKLERIIAFADIGEFIDHPVKTYSSGMFARLAFAIAVHVEPEILIVDEALSVGDIFFQQKCNLYMKEHMHAVTKILVTHDMSTVAKMADRAFLLSNGELVFQGKPLETIEYYKKSTHTELFQKRVNPQQAPATTDIAADDDASWTPIDAEKLGGALEARITRYRYSINNGDDPGFVEEGDRVRFEFVITTTRAIDEGIIGYIVNDKYGNPIFGENSITSGFAPLAIPAGVQLQVGLEFLWPELADGPYFMTLGIGEGQHELEHTIQCWAHNITEFKCINRNKTVHCLFNNAISDIAIRRLDGA